MFENCCHSAQTFQLRPLTVEVLTENCNKVRSIKFSVLNEYKERVDKVSES